ncbi:hypothetical protein BD560DRAFT_430832 [Blakeslea trispora]|nr:hypothetical protein BD560DRAFT_430832 [Blakeslea trispora]
MSSSRDDERDYRRYDRDGGDRDRGYGRHSNRPYQDTRHKPMANENGMHTIEDTVYITNLPQDVTEEKLAAHFGSIGIIKTDKKLRKPKIWIYLDKATQLPKGDGKQYNVCAFLWFGGKEFMGNVIQVSKAERKMPAERGGFRGNTRGGYRSGGGGGGGGGGGSSSMGGGNGGNSEPREGDWSCEKCGASNFSRRNECFKCHAQKSSRKSYGRREEGRREERRHDRRDRPY